MEKSPQKRLACTELLRMSQALGVLKCVAPGRFQNFKLNYHPFESKKSYHEYLGLLHQTWQKVLLKVAHDRQFLINLLSDLAQNDELIDGVLQIVKKRNSQHMQDGISLNRIDYYNDQTGQPKLTEYNLQCIGMMSHMERFQEAKRLLQGGDPSYISCATIQNFAEAVRQIVDLKKMKGVLLFMIDKVTPENDPNHLDQARLEIQYRKRGFKVIRTSLKEMSVSLTLEQNGDLYYANERVAVVYNRSVYRPAHYKFGEGYDAALSWQAREKVALSNAISIPSIQFELVNQKRVQTELAKPQVLRRYASQVEIQILMKTRVGQWEFDSITEQGFANLIQKVQANPKGYLLKPNKQGGGNNIFGLQILDKLRGDRQDLRSYILMQKIITKPSINTIVDGPKCYTDQCEYEISRYGTLIWFNGEIVRNKAQGFLIRAKPITANEGGLMAGVGSIVSWKLIEQGQ